MASAPARPKETLGERKAEMLEAFLRDFPSLEEARKDLSRLGQKHVRDQARAGKCNWYYPATSIFKRADGKKGRWYKEALPQLVFLAGWFEKESEAERFVKEITGVCKKIGIKRNVEANRKMSKEEVSEAFKKDFPSLADARKDLSRLGGHWLRNQAKSGKCNWYYPSRAIFKRPNGEKGEWYENVLPQLVLLAEWLKTENETTQFVEEVRVFCKETGRKRNAEANRKMSKEEVSEAFKKDFPSLADARKDLSRLGQKYAQDQARAGKCDWYYPATSIFKRADGKKGYWYQEALPKLVLLAGWFENEDEAKLFVEEVRRSSKKTGAKRLAEAKRKMSKEEVLAAFKKQFPSLQEARKDLSLLGQSGVFVLAKSGKCDWYYTSYSIFKKADARTGTWYEDVLPQLVFLAGWFKTEDEARKFVEEVKSSCKKIGVKRLAEAKRKMSKEEVLAAFKKQFPSLEEARKDLSRLSAVVGKSKWALSARSIFKKQDGRMGGWYSEILSRLVIHAGWLRTENEAKQFVEKVRDFSQETRIKRIVEARRKTTQDRKTRRDYAIVSHSFRNAKGGASLSGITNLLSLDSVEPRAASQNGLARAVLSTSATHREITPAELLRFKMRAGKWGGEMASAYSEAFQYIAPYLTTRLLLLHIFQLQKEGRINALEKGASFMSGPGEVYQALQDLRPELEKQELRLPALIDIDEEKDMLGKSSNQNKVVARLPNTPLEGNNLDFVECSSLYQFYPGKEPTIVKDTLIEALRVLRSGGALMLTATAKRFSEKFEDGLRLLGFDLITPANTRLLLKEELREKIIEELGPEVLGKSENAVAETYYMVAVKSGRNPEEVPADWFRFEKPKTELPAEVGLLAAQARCLDKDLRSSSSDAISNIGRMAQMLDSLSPEIHERNACLVQTIISKYLLDPHPVKPKEGIEDLRENASRLVEKADRVAIDNKDARDRYFQLLKHMARSHRFKLDSKRRTHGL